MSYNKSIEIHGIVSGSDTNGKIDILGHDTDDSKISLSKFNSYLESKQKAFLDGTTEQLSKKVLLDWSSDGR